MVGVACHSMAAFAPFHAFRALLLSPHLAYSLRHPYTLTHLPLMNNSMWHRQLSQQLLNGDV